MDPAAAPAPAALPEPAVPPEPVVPSELVVLAEPVVPPEPLPDPPPTAPDAELVPAEAPEPSPVLETLPVDSADEPPPESVFPQPQASAIETMASAIGDRMPGMHARCVPSTEVQRIGRRAGATVPFRATEPTCAPKSTAGSRRRGAGVNRDTELQPP